jgi:hypothetical protein
MKDINHSDSRLFPGIKKAFSEMKEESPLLQYEMTIAEMNFAIMANKRSLKTTISANVIVYVIMALGAGIVGGLVMYASVPQSIENAIILISFYTGLFSLLVFGAIIGRFTLFTSEPEVILSYSGMYFLGKFYPFRMSSHYLTAAVCIDAQDKEPAVLRLTLERQEFGIMSFFITKIFGSIINIEVPLRPDMVEQANTIIKILLPE